MDTVIGLEALGFRFTLSGDRLRYEGPEGVDPGVAGPLLEDLRELKAEAVAFLRSRTYALVCECTVRVAEGYTSGGIAWMEEQALGLWAEIGKEERELDYRCLSGNLDETAWVAKTLEDLWSSLESQRPDSDSPMGATPQQPNDIRDNECLEKTEKGP